MTLIVCGKSDCRWNKSQDCEGYCNKKTINIGPEAWMGDFDPKCESYEKREVV